MFCGKRIARAGKLINVGGSGDVWSYPQSSPARRHALCVGDLMRCRRRRCAVFCLQLPGGGGDRQGNAGAIGRFHDFRKSSENKQSKERDETRNKSRVRCVHALLLYIVVVLRRSILFDVLHCWRFMSNTVHCVSQYEQRLNLSHRK